MGIYKGTSAINEDNFGEFPQPKWGFSATRMGVLMGI
jgi:hypothetical protein